MSLYFIILTHPFNKRKTCFSSLISCGIRAMVGSGVSPLLWRIFSVGSPPADLFRWIFSVGSPPTDLLSRIPSDRSSRSISSSGSSLSYLLRLSSIQSHQLHRGTPRVSHCRRHRIGLSTPLCWENNNSLSTRFMRGV